MLPDYVALLLTSEDPITIEKIQDTPLPSQKNRRRKGGRRLESTIIQAFREFLRSLV